MEYVDDNIVEGFKAEMVAQMGDAIEFAVNATVNDGHRSEEELRQVAQDALNELVTPWVDAMVEAYRRSSLQRPDLDAVATLFGRLSVKARLVSLCGRSPEHPNQFPVVTLHTRKGLVEGRLYDMLDHDGEPSAHVGTVNGDQWIPVVSIIEVEEVSTSS